jgi:hypothetical protein
MHPLRKPRETDPPTPEQMAAVLAGGAALLRFNGAYWRIGSISTGPDSLVVWRRAPSSAICPGVVEDGAQHVVMS